MSDSEDDFFAQLGKAISQPAQSKENICLISLEPLESDKIVLSCDHCFNYMPIFQEFKQQIQQGNKILKCPYCRSKHYEYLPMRNNIEYTKYIHEPLENKKCEWVFKIGKRKGEQCDHLPKTYYNGCIYCAAHHKMVKTKTEKDDKPKNTEKDDKPKKTKKKVVVIQEDNVVVDTMTENVKKKLKSLEAKMNQIENTDIMEKPEIMEKAENPDTYASTSNMKTLSEFIGKILKDDKDILEMKNTIMKHDKNLKKIRKKNMPLVKKQIDKLIMLFNEEELFKYCHILDTLLQNYMGDDTIYIGDILMRLAKIIEMLFGVSSEFILEKLKPMKDITPMKMNHAIIDMVIEEKNGRQFVKGGNTVKVDEDSVVIPLKHLEHILKSNILMKGELIDKNGIMNTNGIKINIRLIDYIMKMDMVLTKK